MERCWSHRFDLSSIIRCCLQKQIVQYLHKVLLRRWESDQILLIYEIQYDQAYIHCNEERRGKRGIWGWSSQENSNQRMYKPQIFCRSWPILSDPSVKPTWNVRIPPGFLPLIKLAIGAIRWQLQYDSPCQQSYRSSSILTNHQLLNIWWNPMLSHTLSSSDGPISHRTATYSHTLRVDTHLHRDRVNI